MSTPLAPDDPRHGTYSAYSNHRCRCDSCKDAARRRRKLHPVPLDVNRKNALTRKRASQRLIEMYRGDFDRLLDEERALVGLQRVHRPGR